MKKFLTVIICIALVAGVIFCVNSCRKDNDITPKSNSEGTTQKTQENNIDTEKNIEVKPQKPSTKDYPIQTGTGIYHGKMDSTFIEVLVDGVTPPLRACKLSPELAEKFSSLNLELGAIITFEYQLVDDQYVITKIN